MSDLADDDDSGDVLAALQRADERSLRFTPYGLGIDRALSAAGAARFQAAAIASAQLVAAVPEAVRDTFERARRIHLQGVLDYDLFTVARDYSTLVLEAALRTRFVTYYADGVPVVRGGSADSMPVTDFDEVRSLRRTCKLRAADGTLHPIPIGSAALLRWARLEGLLVGTRSRIVDEWLSELRNRAAHPMNYELVMPPQSARTLRDIAEIINKLWGSDTEGGRLFPGPVARAARVAAIAPDRSASTELRLDQLASLGDDHLDWSFWVILAAMHEDLTRIGEAGLACAHEPGFQTTTYPAHELWSGGGPELVRVAGSGRFEGAADSVPWLDRRFFVREAEDRPDFARSAEDVLAADQLPSGIWHVLVADTPWDAWSHVRDHAPVGKAGTICKTCHVRVVASGLSTPKALELADATGATGRAALGRLTEGPPDDIRQASALG